MSERSWRPRIQTAGLASPCSDKQFPSPAAQRETAGGANSIHPRPPSGRTCDVAMLGPTRKTPRITAPFETDATVSRDQDFTSSSYCLKKMRLAILSRQNYPFCQVLALTKVRTARDHKYSQRPLIFVRTPLYSARLGAEDFDEGGYRPLKSSGGSDIAIRRS